MRKILIFLTGLFFMFFQGCKDESNLIIPTPTTVTDIDGNVYQTVKIGNQTWLAENLKVTHYRNGDVIPFANNNSEWANLTDGGYCSYDNNNGWVDTYGYLYNWYAFNDSRNIAPVGWHVPSDGEWQTLVDYLGGDAVAGGKLKETGIVHWSNPNTGATNESGFTALPGGLCWDNGDSSNLGIIAIFWTTSVYDNLYAWTRAFLSGSSEVFRSKNYRKTYGLSIRLIKDQANKTKKVTLPVIECTLQEF